MAPLAGISHIVNHTLVLLFLPVSQSAEPAAAAHRSCQPFGVSPQWWVMFGCVCSCLTIPTRSITYPEPTCLWLLANEDQINCVFSVHMVPIEELPSTRVGIVLCLSGWPGSDVMDGLDNSKLDLNTSNAQSQSNLIFFDIFFFFNLFLYPPL